MAISGTNLIAKLTRLDRTGFSAQSTAMSHQQAKTVAKSGKRMQIRGSRAWLERTAHEASNPKYLNEFQIGEVRSRLVKNSSRHCLILIIKGML
jgi:hypothetical protein